MTRDDEHHSAARGPLTREPSTSEMLLRGIGMFAVVLLVLMAYFAVVAQQLDGPYGDSPLVTALRVVAGACAISGTMIGLFVLDRRAEATARAKRTSESARAIRSAAVARVR